MTKHGLPLVTRFMLHVDVKDGHWIWKGSVTGKNENCRGQIGVGDKKKKLATHVAWELLVGPVPAGLFVLHKRECNLSRCVFWQHLYLGTQKENVADSFALGARKQNKKKEKTDG